MDVTADLSGDDDESDVWKQSPGPPDQEMSYSDRDDSPVAVLVPF